MESYVTDEFRKHYRALPRDVRKLAWSKYLIWRENPKHRGIGFKKHKNTESRYSAEVGEHYRVLGNMVNGDIVWYWIGTHEEYNGLL